jgi:hypothetical protein
MDESKCKTCGWLDRKNSFCLLWQGKIKNNQRLSVCENAGMIKTNLETCRGCEGCALMRVEEKEWIDTEPSFVRRAIYRAIRWTREQLEKVVNKEDAWQLIDLEFRMKTEEEKAHIVADLLSTKEGRAYLIKLAKDSGTEAKLMEACMESITKCGENLEKAK